MKLQHFGYHTLSKLKINKNTKVLCYLLEGTERIKALIKHWGLLGFKLCWFNSFLSAVCINDTFPSKYIAVLKAITVLRLDECGCTHRFLIKRSLSIKPSPLFYVLAGSRLGSDADARGAAPPRGSEGTLTPRLAQPGTRRGRWRHTAFSEHQLQVLSLGKTSSFALLSGSRLLPPLVGVPGRGCGLPWAFRGAGLGFGHPHHLGH